jgi:hypothetical protein
MKLNLHYLGDNYESGVSEKRLFGKTEKRDTFYFGVSVHMGCGFCGSIAGLADINEKLIYFHLYGAACPSRVFNIQTYKSGFSK